MNHFNNLKIFNSPEDLAENHDFPTILKRSLEFDLAVHKNLFEDKPHVTDEVDQKWITFLNLSLIHI